MFCKFKAGSSCYTPVKIATLSSLPIRRIILLLLCVLCAVPSVLSYLSVSSVAPYLTLLSFVPSLYVIRRLVERREIMFFALTSSLVAYVLITNWLPNALRDALGVSSQVAWLLSVPLWGSWCLGNALFLVSYRYLYTRNLLLWACLSVVLFNYWPSVFGSNPYMPLLFVGAWNGAAYVLGTAPMELVAVLVSAWTVECLIVRRITPLRRAVVLIGLLLALDSFSSWWLSAAPHDALRVALVQASNVYGQKLSSAADIEAFAREIVASKALRPDLVVFPESVFAFNMADDPVSASAAIDALKQVSRQLDTAFLVSSIQAHASEPSRPATSKVTALLLEHGELQGVADKASTIPFAEYTPAWAMWLLNQLGVDTHSRVADSTYQPMRIKGVNIVALSCFESLDRHLVETRLAGNPALLVNQSNLDSFGTPGSAPYEAALWQHMAHEMRWVNQWQVPLVRAVKGGGSTSVTAQGEVDLDTLAGSWGREWVDVEVTVRRATTLDAVLAQLRLVLHGLICAMAALCLWLSAQRWVGIKAGALRSLVRER